MTHTHILRRSTAVCGPEKKSIITYQTFGKPLSRYSAQPRPHVDVPIGEMDVWGDTERQYQKGVGLQTRNSRTGEYAIKQSDRKTIEVAWAW